MFQALFLFSIKVPMVQWTSGVNSPPDSLMRTVFALFPISNIFEDGRMMSGGETVPNPSLSHGERSWYLKMPQDEGVERKLVVKRGRFEVKIRSMIFKVFQILQKPAIKPFPKKRSNGKNLEKPQKICYTKAIQKTTPCQICYYMNPIRN